MRAVAKKSPFGSNYLAANASMWQKVLAKIGHILPQHIPIAVKLAFAIIVLIVAGMGSLGIVIVGNQGQVMRAQLHDFGQTVARQLGEIAGELVLSEDSLGLSVLVTNLANSEKVQGTAIYSDSGILLAAEGIQPKGRLSTAFKRTSMSAEFYEWSWVDPQSPKERLFSFVTPIHYQGVIAGYSMVTLSASLMDAALEKSHNYILYATILMSLVASMLAYAMSRRVSQPIHDLMEATRAIDRGDLQVRMSDRRNDEIGFLMNGFNTMAQGLLRKSQVESVFSRYVSKNVAEKILENLDEVRLGSRHVEATVLFADIVGFTGIAERLNPEEVSELLNEYFSYISIACKQYNGTIDKFIGDCAMLVFGAIEDDHDHSFHAIACAVLIQKLAGELNIRREQQGKPRVDFRIGVNCGQMLAGNLGADERMEYTVVGDAVNLASRLSAVAGAGQIIICQELYQRHDVESRILGTTHDTISVRGRSSKVATYSVEGVHPRHKPVLKANLREVLTSKGKVSASK